MLVAAADHHGVGPLVWQALHAVPRSLARAVRGARGHPSRRSHARDAARPRDRARVRRARRARCAGAARQRRRPRVLAVSRALAASAGRHRHPGRARVARRRRSRAARPRVPRGAGGHDRRVRQSPGRLRAPRSHGLSHVIDLHWKTVNPQALADALPFAAPVAGRRSRCGTRIYVHACRAMRARCCSRACTGWGITSSTSGSCGSTTCTCSPMPSTRAGGTASSARRGSAASARCAATGSRPHARRLGTAVPARVLAALGTSGLERAVTRVHGAHAAAHRRAAGRPPAAAAVAGPPAARDRTRVSAASFMMARYDGAPAAAAAGPCTRTVWCPAPGSGCRA